MAATTWPATQIAGDETSNEYADFAWPQALVDRYRVLESVGWFQYMGVLGPTSSATYISGTTYKVRLPTYARSGRIIQFWGFGWMGTAADQGTWRVEETGGPTNGTGVTFTNDINVTTANVGHSDITIPDGTWSNATKSFRLQLKHDSGASQANCENRVFCNVHIVDG